MPTIPKTFSIPSACRVRTLDAPQWPSESSQGDHLLSFRFVQDVADIDEGYMPHAEINFPGLILVGRFQVTHIGRFWVTPEARKPASTPVLCPCGSEPQKGEASNIVARKEAFTQSWS